MFPNDDEYFILGTTRSPVIGTCLLMALIDIFPPSWAAGEAALPLPRRIN